MGHVVVVRGDEHRPGVGVRSPGGRTRPWCARRWARSDHEAAACDPVGQYVYLTEDAGTGKLRRFRPTVWGDLSAGTLEAAVVSGSTVTWTSTISNGTSFNGGEGAWYADGKVWFTTKGDNRVWELDVRSTPNTIRVIYDDNTSPNPVLTGVDNIVGSASGDLFVAEDGGNMELVLIEPGGAVSVFLRVLNQSGSEIAGPPSARTASRLYFSSQRGPTGSGSGVTYEVTGPFRTPAPPPTTTTTATTTTTTPPVVITLAATTRTVKRKHYVDLTLVRRHDGATSRSAATTRRRDHAQRRGLHRQPRSQHRHVPLPRDPPRRHAHLQRGRGRLLDPVTDPCSPACGP